MREDAQHPLQIEPGCLGFTRADAVEASGDRTETRGMGEDEEEQQ
jgi:hypothetical protein